MKTVKEFMNKKVISLSPDMTIFDAARVLARKDIAGAPVVKKQKIVGIVSLSDIIKFIDVKMGKLPNFPTPGLSCIFLAFLQMHKLKKNFREELKKICSYKISEVMTKNVIIVSSSSSLVEAAEIMEKHDVNRLPVVENEKLVGIVARADLIKALIS